VTAFEHSIQLRLLALRESLLKADAEPGSRERVERELAEVDAALGRMAQGQFGVCVRCGRALGRQRLLAEPVALLCRGCGGGEL
jgi:DnaK suppressor protein